MLASWISGRAIPTEWLPSAAFDMNGDGSVNPEDHRVWVKDLKHTWYGDANLDGEFNSGDLVNVFQAGQYEDAFDDNSGWTSGDWDGDADFTTSDLVYAFQDGGYEQGLRVGGAAVPEPTSSVLALLSGLLLAHRGRRRWTHRR
jgi:hypothetical protein